MGMSPEQEIHAATIPPTTAGRSLCGGFLLLRRECVIELDGSQHGERRAISYDFQRTKWLEEHGYRVLRI